jgi:L-ribulose-5-phosphate 4-epimerase
METERTLRESVAAANKYLVAQGLVFMNFGNASAIDKKREFIYIKPSGFNSKEIEPPQIVRVALNGIAYGNSGLPVDPSHDLKPSVDTPTHLELYNIFLEIGGIVHTHSHYATVFAQSNLSVPCLGTTHADYFNGEIPVTRRLRDDEIKMDYEKNTGKVIVETFRERGINSLEVSACLVSGHGPFVWGKTVESAVENSIVLEHIAKLAFHNLQLDGFYRDADNTPISQALLDRHFLRKHGLNRYYGQKGK